MTRKHSYTRHGVRSEIFFCQSSGHLTRLLFFFCTSVFGLRRIARKSRTIFNSVGFSFSMSMGNPCTSNIQILDFGIFCKGRAAATNRERARPASSAGRFCKPDEPLERAYRRNSTYVVVPYRRVNIWNVNA